MSLLDLTAEAILAAEGFEKNKNSAELRAKIVRVVEKAHADSKIVGSASYSSADDQMPILGIFSQGDYSLALACSPERVVVLSQDNRARTSRQKAVLIKAAEPTPDTKTKVFELPPHPTGGALLPRMIQPQFETPMLFGRPAAAPRPAFETPMLQARLAPRSFAKAAFGAPKAAGCDCDRCRARRHKKH